MIHTYPSPQRALYQPIKSGFQYPVLVLAKRTVFGRIDYRITLRERPGFDCWVSRGITFEEAQP